MNLPRLHNRHIIQVKVAFIQKSNPLISLATPSSLPPHWTELLDEAIPPFIKERFSPQESWKNKPFTKDDLIFFSKGLTELSDFFTVDREGSRLPAYFTTARFRSSYFLYFFALQGAKFLSLFDKYPQAMDAAVEHATKTGTFRVIDVGSGPGTASFALLAYLFNRYDKTKKIPFKVEMVWIDRNKTILEDGGLLLNNFLSYMDEYDGDFQLKKETRDWWKHGKDFNHQASLVLFGNVLNESPADPQNYQKGLLPFLEKPTGGGVLFIEPAFRVASQRLSQIRDELALDEKRKTEIWGPCLHKLKCPLAEGRDWCHFSVPAKLPGKWFRQFSIKLGGVREWLKFSFLWVAASESASKTYAGSGATDWFRVVSDPIKTKQGMKTQVCTPEQISWMDSLGKRYFRGDLVQNPQQNQQNNKPARKRK